MLCSLGLQHYFKISENLHLPIMMLQVYIHTFSDSLIQGRKQSWKLKKRGNKLLKREKLISKNKKKNRNLHKTAVETNLERLFC